MAIQWFPGQMHSTRYAPGMPWSRITVELNDFRTGARGHITLESPDQFTQWWAQGQPIEAERRERREKRSRRGK